jgi:hypothetical protein
MHAVRELEQIYMPFILIDSELHQHQLFFFDYTWDSHAQNIVQIYVVEFELRQLVNLVSISDATVRK